MNADTRIKFRHLICFLEVARQGSFARAADALAVSQPAVSKTLKELEDLLEASLFSRGKGGVALTAAGVAFMRYAGPCVQALREGVSSLREGAPEVPQARVGVLSSAESQLMGEVVTRLHRRHEALVVSVATGSSAALLDQLRVGELDLVIGRMADSPAIQGLSFEHLYSESMTLVVRPGHPLLQASPGELGRLSGFPLVLPLAGTTIRRHADSLFVQLGITPSHQRLETLSPALSRRYVLAGDAVWVAPEDAVNLELRRGELMELQLGIREPGGSVGICRNAAIEPPQAALWVAEVLREVAQDHHGTSHGTSNS